MSSSLQSPQSHQPLIDQGINQYTIPPQSPQCRPQSPYSLQLLSNDKSSRSPKSPLSPHSRIRASDPPRPTEDPSQVQRPQTPLRLHSPRSLLNAGRSRFSDFSIDSEETRIRALYQRITAAQPISYKSAFVDVEEKEEPRPSGVRLRWWLSELLASTLSIAVLCALVLLLHNYNGRKESDWPSRLFTLNSVTALLAALTRICFMIPVVQAISQAKWDWFSNGRWREIRSGKPLQDLEAFDKASRGPLGSLRLIWRLSGWHLPTIGALLTILSLGFDTFAQQALTTGYRTGAAKKFTGNIPRAETYQDSTSSSSSSLGISAKAAINNGFLSENVLPASASCPSGDCSWPTSPTLAVCGACIDVTKTIKTTNLNTNRQGQPVVLTVGEGSKSILNSSAVGDSSVEMLIADFNIIGSQSQTLADPTATECALWFCLQALDVKQVSGNQTTTITSSWNEASVPSGSDSYTFTSIPPSFNTLLDTNFTIDTKTFNASTDYVTSLTSNASVSSSDSGYTFSTDTAQAIWSSFSDLDAWIQRVATSMTNHVRLTGFSGDQASIDHYSGTTNEDEAFFNVRWVWLSYPAGMVLLALLYLIASMVSASSSGTHIWKSSPLPLLLVDVDPNLKMQAERGMNEPGGLLKAAGSRKVSLVDEDGKWALRATEGSPILR
ncbi:MAG: hypothetical protein M1820_009916 [Bogoriella megaspora]|nr:MAG: hypothetical protein M1820_009916 [Bogoriella megaspora]